MTYVILSVVILGCAAWAYYLGSQVSALKKDIQNRNDYIKRQYEVLTAFMRAVRERKDLDAFLDQLDACDDAAQFNELLASRVSSSAVSSTSG